MHNERARQRRQAHRKRKALGRALHQVRRMRHGMQQRYGILRAVAVRRFSVPKIVRKHARMLRQVLAFG